MSLKCICGQSEKIIGTQQYNCCQTKFNLKFLFLYQADKESYKSMWFSIDGNDIYQIDNSTGLTFINFNDDKNLNNEEFVKKSIKFIEIAYREHKLKSFK